ncbi:unnamed protein product, partial [Didymodactylos carnosus]
NVINNVGETTDLSLMGHGIKRLDKIPLRKTLLSVDLHSNQIEKISSLTALNNLIHLDLSSNNIQRIQNLECLVSLNTLNLASNKICVVEGLFSLKKLTWLNLSYNNIEYLQGFQDLWGPQYNLSILQMHGNQIDSLDEITKNLSGLSHLHHITFRENPVENYDVYRLTIFNCIRTLLSLDGMDQHGKKDFNSQGLPGIEQYMGLMKSNLEENRYRLQDVNDSLTEEYPQIAAALNMLRHHKTNESSSISDIHSSMDKENGSILEGDTVPRSKTDNDANASFTSQTHHISAQPRHATNEKLIVRSPSTDSESDHHTANPHRSKQRITIKSTSQRRHQPTSTQSILFNESTKKPSRNQYLTVEDRIIPSTYNRSKKSDTTSLFRISNGGGDNNERNQREQNCDEYCRKIGYDESREIYMTTLRDLDSERDKRWRAEQEIKRLNDLIDEWKKRGRNGRAFLKRWEFKTNHSV